MAFYILGFGIVGSGIMVISALNPIHFDFLVSCCLYWFCGFFSLAGDSFCCFNVFNNLCGGYCYFIFVCNYAIEFNRFSPPLFDWVGRQI